MTPEHKKEIHTAMVERDKLRLETTASYRNLVYGKATSSQYSTIATQLRRAHMRVLDLLDEYGIDISMAEDTRAFADVDLPCVTHTYQ